MPYVLTRGEAESQLDVIRGRANQLLAGLDPIQFNWQPDRGRRWSIGQCLEHLSRTTMTYGERIDAAIAAAPPAGEQSSAVPGLLGRWMIWTMEPPALLRLPTRAALQPHSGLDPDDVRRRFSDSLRYAAEVAARALQIDASRTKFANPFLNGMRAFDVATGVLVMLAHNRRHLAQAEKVRQHRDFPR